MPRMRVLASVDHLVYAGPDLREAIARIDALLGVRATPGGAHPNRGTRNALIALGPRVYLEIIGPDPDQPEPSQPRPFGIDDLSEPRLVRWSAREADLEGLSQRAATAGISLGAIGNGSRIRPDGVLLTWRFTDPRVVGGDGLVPFFIDWGQTPHPAESAIAGGQLVGLRSEHPAAADVAAQLQGLGLALRVAQAPEPALIATIAASRGVVELR